ncbi:MAG: DUF2892 domain-containing protein [Thiohalocapsa sp. PB-PSB1]|jgi:hypothetical protein|nr:MAG: hypothetical protein N838_23660 [Thiohalocapsa sp. PB-PSB1]QQO55422.1 MAG: DUF2892 domain-containing protein [Thiohalocapsa sp. PB-PSB1]HCS88758.1 DUF2892 domain-containing protein [Chromatiaceae bacterium]
MSIERIVFAVAGSFVLVSAILAATTTTLWLWFTGFVGLNLLQSAFTGFCPMASILKKFGIQSGSAF